MFLKHLLSILLILRMDLIVHETLIVSQYFPFQSFSFLLLFVVVPVLLHGDLSADDRVLWGLAVGGEPGRLLFLLFGGLGLVLEKRDWLEFGPIGSGI
jgi:hypothetical protein